MHDKLVPLCRFPNFLRERPNKPARLCGICGVWRLTMQRRSRSRSRRQERLRGGGGGGGLTGSQVGQFNFQSKSNRGDTEHSTKEPPFHIGLDFPPPLWSENQSSTSVLMITPLPVPTPLQGGESQENDTWIELQKYCRREILSSVPCCCRWHFKRCPKTPNHRSARS